mgnify:CR=1 FL=1
MDKDKQASEALRAKRDRMKALLAKAAVGGAVAGVALLSAGPKLPPGMGD